MLAHAKFIAVGLFDLHICFLWWKIWSSCAVTLALPVWRLIFIKAFSVFMFI